MIIEKLMKQTDFTKVEKSIADYLMKNGFDVKNMSIQTLAHETFTSPSTITRFCKKLGLDGYKKFQILFYSEYEVYASQGAVDANYPFSGSDSFEQIARKLAKLNHDTINKAMSGFDYNQFQRIVRRMSRADMINIFSVGTSATVAMEFQQKMLRFGKNRKSDNEFLFSSGICTGRVRTYCKSDNFAIWREQGCGRKSEASEKEEEVLRWYYSDTGKYSGEDVSGSDSGGCPGTGIL